jgi:hypothetical protein
MSDPGWTIPSKISGFANLHLHDAKQPAFRNRECMIGQNVVAGKIKLEFHDHGATRWPP